MWFTVVAGVFGALVPVGFVHAGVVLAYIKALIDVNSATDFVLYFNIFLLSAYFSSRLWGILFPLGKTARHIYFPLPGFFPRDWNLARLWLAFWGMLAVSYAANVVRFHKPLYFLETVNAFASSRELAGGSWFIIILTTSYLIPAVMLLGKLLEDRKLRAYIFVTLVSVIGTIIVAKASNRTVTLVVAITALLVSKPAWPRSLYRLIWVAAMPAGAIGLTVLNMIRLGKGVQWSAIGGFMVNVYLALSPSLNGIFLTSQWSAKNYILFKYLPMAMSPFVMIPSALLPEKGYVDLQSIFTDHLFPTLDPRFFSDGSVLTYTLVGAGYGELGPLGVAIVGVLWVLLIGIVMRLVMSKDGAVRAFSIYLLVSMAMSYRTCMESIFIQLQYHIYLMMLIGFYASKPFRSWISRALTKLASGAG